MLNNIGCSTEPWGDTILETSKPAMLAVTGVESEAAVG